MVEGVEISIFFDNTHKKYHILAGILSFVFMKKFAYRTEDSDLYVRFASRVSSTVRYSLFRAKSRLATIVLYLG